VLVSENVYVEVKIICFGDCRIRIAISNELGKVETSVRYLCEVTFCKFWIFDC
jgi:predicted Ser/Thr protein kinase